MAVCITVKITHDALSTFVEGAPAGVAYDLAEEQLADAAAEQVRQAMAAALHQMRNPRPRPQGW